MLTDGRSTLYHSGDCVPYPGLVDRLNPHTIDVAIMPINGRDEFRRSRGVPGNFRLDEAIEICRTQGIPNLVACHFGMFEFNTVDEKAVVAEISKITELPRCFLPRVDRWLELQQ